MPLNGIRGPSASSNSFFKSSGSVCRLLYYKCDKSDCKQRRTAILHLRAQGNPMLRGLPIATKAWRPPGVDTGGCIVLVAETDTGCIFGASGACRCFRFALRKRMSIHASFSYPLWLLIACPTQS